MAVVGRGLRLQGIGRSWTIGSSYPQQSSCVGYCSHDSLDVSRKVLCQSGTGERSDGISRKVLYKWQLGCCRFCRIGLSKNSHHWRCYRSVFNSRQKRQRTLLVLGSMLPGVVGRTTLCIRSSVLGKIKGTKHTMTSSAE